MDEIVASESGWPLKFPDHRKEMAARAREFRALSFGERVSAIAALMEFGMKIVRESPRRAEIELRWKQQEDESQRIQTEIFKRNGI